ncbi:MAG: helix-hairpin-helix domain-containing protein, partial [Acidobacteria bacterium]|nr:helix-hairpin-helix domain-containing protein [Acidobacteriota bacterium]
REISFGGRTFVDAPAPPRRPRNQRPPREPRPGQPPAPPVGVPPAPDANAATPPAPGAPPAPSNAPMVARAEELASGASLVEKVTASGAVSTYLVGGAAK